MLKKLITISSLFFLVITIGFGQDAKPQNKYTQLVDQDSIVISYRWKTMPNTKNAGPLKLDLRIENKSPKSQEVSFVVNVFQNTIIYASSETQIYCLSPNKIIFGDKKYSSFDTTELSPENLNEELITVDLSELTVKETPLCK